MSLSIQGLQIRRANHAIIEDFNLDVAAEEFVAITGPSGCGKSTLLNAIAGLVPAASGEIKVDRRSLGYVFQRPMLLPWRNVLDNAAFGLECQGATKQHARGLANELLERTGLGEFLDFLPHELSEGMKQRLNVARAFSIKPNLVLMDEPFSALDAESRKELQDLVIDLWKEAKCTILLVSHFLEELAYMADRVLVLTDRPAKVAKSITFSTARPRGINAEGLYDILRAMKEIKRIP